MKTFTFIALSLLVPTLALAQAKKASAHKPANSKPTVSAAPATPHAYAQQLRASVNADPNIRYRINYTDDDDDDITDSVLVPSDCRHIEYFPVDRRTGQAKGMARSIYWPSLRDCAKGKVIVIDDDERPVGPWTLWYDAPGKHRMLEVTFGPDGQMVAGTIQRWKEDGTDGCQTHITVLPNMKKVVHSQWNVETTDPPREVVPVELPENTVSIVVNFDIRDGDAPPAFWGQMASAALAYASGGATIAIKAFMPTSPPSGTTKCFYFVTDSQEAAQRFQTTGEVVPGYLYRVSSAMQEQHPFVLPRPTRRIWVCVANENMRAAATLSLLVEAVADACGNTPR